MARARLRDLGITIGVLPTGAHNAITDVPGVRVGHTTIIRDEPRVARTGVTVVMPRGGTIWQDSAVAGFHSFNGNGEMTGMHWVAESGLLGSPIGITNTFQVGVVRDAFIAYAIDKGCGKPWHLPVVAETFDGKLNDIGAFHVTREHVYKALDEANGGPVAEGNVGGGTGMCCHGFKGGIGTSSRVVDVKGKPYTVGALVQANYGKRELFRVDGVPVGREIGPDHTPLVGRTAPEGNSIIIVVGTDAPLIPLQCRRLAQRATVGLARVGGVGHNGSGDIFLAFSTGNHLDEDAHGVVGLQMLDHNLLNRLFDAVAEAVEESILNALTAAETMTGCKGYTAHAIPLDELKKVMAKYNRGASR